MISGFLIFFFKFVEVCFMAQNETAGFELSFCFGNYQYTKCSKVYFLFGVRV